MGERIVIERRFRGPSESANGGYACGMLAAHLGTEPAVEATLRAPPPLDRALTVERQESSASMLDGDTLVAEASPARVPDLALPDPITLDDAHRAREASPMQTDHPYPMCFVCGSDRAKGDGLCLTCGPVAGREDRVVAAPFETDDTMAAEDGSVRMELVWSVLDCPGGIAGMLVPELGLSVLGRLTAAINAPLEVGRDYVAVGWPIEHEGRKMRAGTAILDEGGRALAVSEATWIEVREQPPA